MRCATYWFTVVLCVVASPIGICQPAQPGMLAAGPERELRAPSVSGKTIISTSRKQLSWGEEFDIQVRFQCIGGFAQFFNPFFRTLTEQSAEIAVFDAGGKYLGDLLTGIKPFSFRPPAPEEWVWIPAGCFVGTTLRFRALAVTRVFDAARPLPPGSYRIQAVYHSRFVSQPVKLDASLLRDKSARDPVDLWYATYRDRDLFRSNVIEIELTR